jgi:hypothetical protein
VEEGGGSVGGAGERTGRPPGTEHLLLGILFAKGDAGQLLIGLGLTAGQAEQALASEFARIHAERGGGS